MPEPQGRRRLDQPRSAGRFRLSVDPDAFGRLSERLARFLGTGTFLFWQTIIVVAWIAVNLLAVSLRWDPYPFILLNLAFSTQAAYAAPLILLAQNRQDDRDRVSLEEDRRRAEQTKADTEYLARELAALRIAVGEVATRDFLRGELDRVFREGGKKSGKSKKQREERDGDEREPGGGREGGSGGREGGGRLDGPRLDDVRS
ncbi:MULTISPECIES: DUF1003 domain-containing protein [Actinosynnema]|uniref:DUF1003 domain-containing protein n=1 Tax=Actinosynnema pretiosum TaxID=42197 RepID=A0A290Z0N0_9PSEU|nr:DUF1003 domain-containing protein [Actinosynnema pretiosum]ATE52545.1 hypothetical protein CNX65_03970 [Actinosynnema pretiosum]